MLSYEELLQRIRQAVFGYDQPGRADHYVRYTYPDRVIIWERIQDTHYSATYSADGREVEIQPKAEWQPVERIWQAVTDTERTAMEGVKRLVQGDARVITSEQQRLVSEVRSFQQAFRPEIRMSADENRSTFLIMTDQVARDGMIVERDGLDVGNFMNNPVVLWQHGQDPVRGAVPIARCVGLVPKDLRRGETLVRGWLATIEWETDDFSRQIRDMVKRGTVSAASIRWSGLAEMQTRDGQRVPVYTRSELLEFSIVAVQGDADALVTERAAASSGGSKPENASGATALAAPEGTDEDDTSSRSAPEVPVMDGPPSGEDMEATPPPQPLTATLDEIRAAKQRRRERALKLAKQRAGMA